MPGRVRFCVNVSSELTPEQRKALEDARCKIGRLHPFPRARTGVCLRARSEEEAIEMVAEALGLHPIQNDFTATAIPIMARITVPRVLADDEQRALKGAGCHVRPKDRSESQWIVDWTDADKKGVSTGTRDQVAETLGIEDLDAPGLDFREPCEGID